MKKIGIVGGIGPASTLDYYNGIINGVREKTKNDNYPEIVINSVNMTKMLSILSLKDWDALTDMLINAIKALDAAGAEIAAIASNTPHIVFDRVQAGSNLPIISIVKATCEYAKKKNNKKSIIIGTRFTMSSGLYSEALEKYNIASVVPSEEEQLVIHNIIFPKLENGIVDLEDKKKMLEIVNSLKVDNSADALLLGCTELPLMIQNNDVDIEVLNTTQIHVEEIINQVL